MKCTKCGAEIKKGNLYCSKCGAEVQIVSAYNVMEDEFFLDFQNREIGKHSQRGMSDISAGLQKKNLYVSILTAMIGFLILLVLAFLIRMNAGDTAKEEVMTLRYTQFIQALADGNEKKANACLQQGIAEEPENLADRFWLAWLYGSQKNYDKQTETLHQILAMDGENSYACRELINVYVKKEDFEGLHEFYDRCEGSNLTALFNGYLVEEPVIEMPQHPMRAGDTLTITAEQGLNVYYTLDGSSPIRSGILYYAPIKLETGSFTLSAVACNEDGYYSTVVSQELTVERRYQLGMPQVTPDSGEYLAPQTIYVNVPEGCTAYYTWNGSNPTTASRKYYGGIAMPEGNNVLSVILVDAYGNMSSVQRVNYIYMPQ
ncbi:MAG: chitobiase/beta-hexosaminidase C-terminal domain-containing protein [Lachnospiraceae bacterium]|nr:chitobiase/beta-hexosaminidase C-terminal domain-containing protein [Lachnospiraceae bacterium]